MAKAAWEGKGLFIWLTQSVDGTKAKREARAEAEALSTVSFPWFAQPASYTVQDLPQCPPPPQQVSSPYQSLIN